MGREKRARASAPVGQTPRGLRGNRFRLQMKFMVLLSFITIGIMTIVVLLVGVRLKDTLLRQTEGRGVSVAQSIAAVTTPSLLGYNYVALEQAARKAAREEGIAYVILLDKEGEVAGDSRNLEHQSQRLLDALSVRAAAATDVLVQEVGESRTGRLAEILDIAVPVFVEDSNEKWGTVRVGLTLAAVQAEIDRTEGLLLLIGMGGVIVSLSAARWASRRIAGPVEELVRGTLAIADGNLSHRIDIQTGDEIEELATQFNHMAVKLEQDQKAILQGKEELEALNESLEDLVTIRTRELTASETRYRQFVESAPMAVSVVSGERRLYVNPAFCSMFGCTPEQALSEEFAPWSLVPEEDREKTAEKMAESEATGQMEPTEMRLRTIDGRMLNVEVRGTRLEYDGEPAWMYLVTDVTAMRSLQERLWQHEKLRALGELAAGVAHDFNNVLGVILGRSQLLQRKISDPDILRGLDVIQKAAVDGGQTVRRVQEYARARRGSERGMLDWNEILRDVVEITRGRWKNDAERRGVRIAVRTDLGDVPPVYGNASELREVLTNLVFNAIDAMPQGGEIVLSSCEEGGQVVSRIADNGLGMSEEVRSRIFDPFFTTKGTRGMGLGLSVAFGIITRHEGRIEAESQPGKGTTFVLTLPIAPAVRESREKESAPQPVPRARILVIDDEEDIRSILRDLLLEAGHQVRTAPSGEEGLDLVNQESFDLILTDIGMPGLSGWETARLIKEMNPEVPIGFITGWGDTLDEGEVERHRIDFVISKPFDVDRALLTIEGFLRASMGNLRKAA